MKRTTHYRIETLLPGAYGDRAASDIACGLRVLGLTLLLASTFGPHPAAAQAPRSGSAVHSASKDAWRKQWQEKWQKEHGGGASAVSNTGERRKATGESAGAQQAAPATNPAPKPVLAPSANAATAGNTLPNANTAPVINTAAPAAKAPATSPVPTNADVITHAPAETAPASPVPASPPAVTPPIGSAPAAGTSTNRAGATVPPPAAGTAVNATSTALSDTRADLFKPDDPALGSTSTGDHTQDNPMASVGDSWKMVAYLIPMLFVILGSLNLLKRFQERTGRLPGVVQSASRLAGGGRGSVKPRSGGLLNALLGSFHLNNARQAGGSNIHLVESMPIGNANVHLLEVRGRLLLLGASAAGVHLLTEFEAHASPDSEDFRDLLHAAAADMDAMDYTQDDMPAAASVSTLEDLMRDTGQAVTQRSRRLRALQEDEIAD